MAQQFPDAVQRNISRTQPAGNRFPDFMGAFDRNVKLRACFFQCIINLPGRNPFSIPDENKIIFRSRTSRFKPDMIQNGNGGRNKRDNAV